VIVTTAWRSTFYFASRIQRGYCQSFCDLSIILNNQPSYRFFFWCMSRRMSLAFDFQRLCTLLTCLVQSFCFRDCVQVPVTLGSVKIYTCSVYSGLGWEYRYNFWGYINSPLSLRSTCNIYTWQNSAQRVTQVSCWKVGIERMKNIYLKILVSNSQFVLSFLLVRTFAMKDPKLSR
jgi:hypothetical protein